MIERDRSFQQSMPQSDARSSVRSLSRSQVGWIRKFARAWAVIAIVAFIGLALRRGVPTNPELGEWQQPAQLALLLMVAVGAMVAMRSEGAGATIISLGAVFLGILATVENSPETAFLAALVFLVPGFLFWFLWQRDKSRSAVVMLALLMTGLLATGGYASSTLHDYLFGPTHPQSETASDPIDIVEWAWSGAATDTSIRVNAKMVRDYQNVQLVVSSNRDMTEQVISSGVAAESSVNQRLVTLTVDKLEPDSHYYYAIRADGRLDRGRRGEFRTFPSGPATFSFAFSSCARSGSNGKVFDAIRESNPLFYLNAGDIHYTFIDEPDPDRFRDSYDQLHAQPAQSALYRSTPIVYAWDDHDYGPDDGDRTSPTREVASMVYQESVPHYPLAASGETTAIYHAFTVGRVRFIVTDTRSERDPSSGVDNASKSLLGEDQKDWLKSELLRASEEFPLIFWVNSVPWIDKAGDGKDTWGGYSTERRELADFIATHDIEGLVMLSGDAHMLAIDDGTNSDYSSDASGGFPVMQAAPLDNHASVKGGPYSEGVFTESGQFGYVTVKDEGDEVITVTLSGRDFEGKEVIEYSFDVPSKSER